MKVLVIGAEFDRSEKALLRGLRSAGIEIEVIFDPYAPEYQRFAEMDIPADGIRFSSRLDFSAIKLMRWKVESARYDIIHSLTNRALSNALLATRGLLGVRHIAYRGTIGHLSRWDPASWMTHLNPRVDRIICVSEAVREYLKTLRLPESRLVTIYKGHDTDWYPRTAETLPSGFGIPSDAFVAGYVGGLRPVKGLEYLIQSATYLPGDAGIHYLIFGKGVLEEKLKCLVSKLGVDSVVHFAGFSDDAATVIGACDVFVMPSVEREGLPRGVIEAMSQGMPAVVSRVGGMPELVKDRECGIVVEPRSAMAIAEAVKLFAADRAMVVEYGKAAKRRIEREFNIKDTIRKTLALYREVTAC